MTWPILIAVYYRLARREEREAVVAFGDAYCAYEVRVPMFVPRLRRLPEPRWSAR
jgi:methanethiol S-methyltransferase